MAISTNIQGPIARTSVRERVYRHRNENYAEFCSLEAVRAGYARRASVASLNRSTSVRPSSGNSKRKRILRVLRLSIYQVQRVERDFERPRFPLTARHARINSCIVRLRGPDDGFSDRSQRGERFDSTELAPWTPLYDVRRVFPPVFAELFLSVIFLFEFYIRDCSLEDLKNIWKVKRSAECIVAVEMVVKNLTDLILSKFNSYLCS